MQSKKQKQNKSFATSFAANMAVTPIDPTTMVSFGLMMKRRTNTQQGVYIRLGRCALKGISMSNLLTQELPAMLRRMLLALLICQRFYKVNLPARSVWLLKAQQSAISRIVLRKYKKCTLNELYSEVIQLSQSKENRLLFTQFPRVLYIDISQNATSMARYLIWLNYVYIRDLSSIKKSMASKK